jgi:SAM-dependent methyltransferase
MSSEKSGEQQEFTWEAYYKSLEGREPRPLFMEALAKFGNQSGHGLQAVDLGCGDGTETVALLEAGWSVLAIDSEPAAITYVQSKVPVDLQPQLQTRTESFESLELPKADMVYAGFSLPFCDPEYFDQMWANVTDHIRPGGRFVGQFFGTRDSWADERDMTFHSSQQVESMLAANFEVEAFEEIDEDGNAFSGPKHWHIFDIIARKLDP